MRRGAVGVLAAALLALAACAPGGGGAQGEGRTPPADGTPPPAAAPAEAGRLDSYEAAIHSCRQVTDSSGEPAVQIGYTFTNRSGEPASGLLALSEAAYQNGVELDPARLAEGSGAADKLTEIAPGDSIELQSAYRLISETAPVEFELIPFLSLSEDRLIRTFPLAEGGETVLSAAPGGDPSGRLGEYEAAVASHAVVQDSAGNSVLVVTLGFTNHSGETANFMTAVLCRAFQDGVELEFSSLADEDGAMAASQMRNLRPGAGIPVTVAYTLTGGTAPVTLTVKDFLGSSGEQLEAVLEVAE